MTGTLNISIDNPKFLLKKESNVVDILVDGKVVSSTKFGDEVQLNYDEGTYDISTILHNGIISRKSQPITVKVQDRTRTFIQAKYSKVSGNLTLKN
ncbi:MAG: hypothetical protein JKY34_03330 [Kordiimonadaceae bacterium]|nr:hypothetical protein [Kordiimonadaceae bacterium]